jgi:poly(hydroxyalkanoate) granule-associated protein
LETGFEKKEASMARKTSSRRRSPTSSGNDTAQAVRDSAQKIWLAGLGAFERAKTEGPRMFESLVEQGRNIGARAVGAADEALKNMRQANFSGGKWDKLEQVFEERVSKSLGRLGVLTGREVESLSKQVADLNETVRELMRGGSKPASGGARRAKSTAKRAKSTAGRATSTAKRSAAPRARKAKAKAKAAA